jgi:hypothetical protein
LLAAGYEGYTVKSVGDISTYPGDLFQRGTQEGLTLPQSIVILMNVFDPA